MTLSELEAYPPYDDGKVSTMEQYDASGTEVPNDQDNLPQFIPPDQGTWPLAAAVESVLNATSLTNVAKVVVYNGETAETPALTRRDLDPGDFAEPGEVPVLAVYGGYGDYYRPWRGGTDANSLDKVDTSISSSADANGPLNIKIYEDDALDVTVTPSTATAVPGQSVTFQASSDAPAGDAVQYAWTVDGQPVAEPTGDATQSVPFSDTGSYQVVVAVTDSSTGDTGGGTSTVTVAGQQTATQTGTSTLPVGGSGSANSGPSQSDGATLGASAGTQTGPASPSAATTSPRATSGPGTTPTSTPAQTRTSAASRTTTTTAAAAAGGGGGTGSAPAATAGNGAAPSTAGASPPGAAVSRTAPSSVPAQQPSASTARHRSDTHAAAPRAVPSSRLISGLLISGVALSAEGSEPASSPGGASAHAPALASVGHTSLLTAVAAGAGVLLLLGFGVGQELRGRRFAGRWARSHTA